MASFCADLPLPVRQATILGTLMSFADFRSRLFLITPPLSVAAWDASFPARFQAALSGSRNVAGQDAQADQADQGLGDVGCILLDVKSEDDRALDSLLEPLVRQAQARNVAVLILDDTRLAGRLGADGIQISDPKILDPQDQARLQDNGLMLGVGGINTRHLALQTGERGVDYLFFGRTDREATPQTHPKTLGLSLWWAQMMAIPCVALAGTEDEAFDALAMGGVEFIAVREQVWRAGDPAQEVERLNSRLDTIARQRMAEAA